MNAMTQIVQESGGKLREKLTVQLVFRRLFNACTNMTEKGSTRTPTSGRFRW